MDATSTTRAGTEPVDLSGVPETMLPLCARARHTLSPRPRFQDRDAVELGLEVADPTDTRDIQRGKQSLNPRTIWYTATSGIWGSVWMELLPRTAIEAVDIRSEPDLSGFRLRVGVEGAGRGPLEVEVDLPDGGRLRARDGSESGEPVAQEPGSGVAGLLGVELGGGQGPVLDGGHEVLSVGGPGGQRRAGPGPRRTAGSVLAA